MPQPTGRWSLGRCCRRGTWVLGVVWTCSPLQATRLLGFEAPHGELRACLLGSEALRGESRACLLGSAAPRGEPRAGPGWSDRASHVAAHAVDAPASWLRDDARRVSRRLAAPRRQCASAAPSRQVLQATGRGGPQGVCEKAMHAWRAPPTVHLWLHYITFADHTRPRSDVSGARSLVATRGYVCGWYEAIDRPCVSSPSRALIPFLSEPEPTVPFPTAGKIASSEGVSLDRLTVCLLTTERETDATDGSVGARGAGGRVGARERGKMPRGDGDDSGAVGMALYLCVCAEWCWWSSWWGGSCPGEVKRDLRTVLRRRTQTS